MMVRLLTILLLWTASAQAEDARAHYSKGTSYYALGKFAEAAVEYEKAYELHPDSALLYNAAQAQRMAGNKPRALFLYENYLRLYESAPNRAETYKFVAQLKAAIENEKNAPPSPAPAPVRVEPQKTELIVEKQPEKKRTLKPWMWGVIGGSIAVVVGVSLGVGLGLGLERGSLPGIRF
jgi:tetratricopeptide (TPR) repeat protein